LKINIVSLYMIAGAVATRCNRAPENV